MKKKIAKYLITKKWFISIIRLSLPNDIQAYDSVMELRKEVKDKNQDEDIVDINGWLMGVNWCKDFMIGNEV